MPSSRTGPVCSVRPSSDCLMPSFATTNIIFLITIMWLECLKYILEILGMLTQMIRHENVEQSEVMRYLWFPTVQAIKAHPIPIDSQIMQESRDFALDIWLRFGLRLGLYERQERRRFEALAEQGETIAMGPALSVPGARSCRWKDCLCSLDTKPPHRMRICKGCWRVWYCGPNCQTK